MHRFHAFVLARPRAVLLALLALWLALLPGLARLELATDGRALVPRDAPALADDARIRADFGVGDEIALLVHAEHADGIWNAQTLERVAALTSELARVACVDPASVRSIATEPGDQVRPGTLELVPWLEPFPADAAAIADLRKRMERVDLYQGTLLARESPAGSTCIVFRLREGVDRRAACAELAEFVERGGSGLQNAQGPGARRAGADLGENAQGSGARRAGALCGSPIAESRFGDHLIADLALLVPLCFAVLALVLWIGFRSAWAVLIPLAGVGFALTTTLAVMGWSGTPVYLTVLVLPVLLTSVGIADAVHVFDRTFAAARALPAREALRFALAETAGSVLAAELTTALGFASFALSPLPPVRAFGIFATFGVALYAVWSLAALPAALAWITGRGGELLPAQARASRLRERLASFCARCAAGPAARPWPWIAGCALAALACAHGASRVRVQDSWLDGFAPTSDTRRDAALLEESFGGAHVLRIAVDARRAHAEGLFAREDVDENGLWIPGAPAAPAALVGHRVDVTPVGLAPDDPRAATLGFWVEDARAERDGTRLALRHERLQIGLHEMLDANVAGWSWRLSAEGRLADPARVALLERLESFLAARADLGVGKVLGPHGHLRTLDQVLGTSAESSRLRLAKRAGIERTLELYARGRGPERLSEVWHPDRDRALVTVLVRGANFLRVGELFRELREFERTELAPQGLALTFGGDLALSQALIQGIVSSEVRSLLAALVSILLVTAVWTRSLKLGLACALPCAFGVLGDFALLGWAGVALGVATSMFAAMILGVGVDYAVHLARRARQNASAGAAPAEAIVAAYGEIGPAVLIDAAAVGLGFGVLLVSSVPPTRHLGALLVASLALCVAATLTLFPAVLRLSLRSQSRA